jgi:hypothetical protein
MLAVVPLKMTLAIPVLLACQGNRHGVQLLIPLTPLPARAELPELLLGP